MSSFKSQGAFGFGYCSERNKAQNRPFSEFQAFAIIYSFWHTIMGTEQQIEELRTQKLQNSFGDFRLQN